MLTAALLEGVMSESESSVDEPLIEILAGEAEEALFVTIMWHVRPHFPCVSRFAASEEVNVGKGYEPFSDLNWRTQFDEMRTE